MSYKKSVLSSQAQTKPNAWVCEGRRPMHKNATIVEGIWGGAEKMQKWRFKPSKKTLPLLGNGDLTLATYLQVAHCYHRSTALGVDFIFTLLQTNLFLPQTVCGLLQIILGLSQTHGIY